MNKLLLEQNLSTQAIAALQGIHIHELLDSTNLEALRLLQSGARENQLVLANAQSSGRGRRGRTWHSPAQGGLYMSLLYFIRTVEPAARPALQGLSLVTALSLYRTLGNYCHHRITLKWPNDVLVDDRKLAGILLETRAVADCSPLVIGIGVNLSLSPAQREKIDRPACALDEWSVTTREVLCGQILSVLMANIEQYLAEGFTPFQADWNSCDRHLGDEVIVGNGNQQVAGKSLGVDATGALLLQTSNGQQRISGGEVLPSLRTAREARKL